MTHYYDRYEIAAINKQNRDREDKLREVVIELAAALVRMDKNGYQERLLERTLKDARVMRSQVDDFNTARATAQKEARLRNDADQQARETRLNAAKQADA